MTYQLHRLSTQLDPRIPTAGGDCAVRAIINGFLTISDGRVGPQNDAQEPAWVHLVRTAAGAPHGGLLFQSQTFRAVRSPLLMHEFDKVGLPHPFVELKVDFGWAHAYRRMRAGWLALLPIDYGVLNHLHQAPSGSLSFGDGHLVAATNPVKGHNGWLFGDIADSLMDGRMRWVNGRIHQYPRGWQHVRLQYYRKPAGAWGADPVGAGHVYAIFIKPRS